MMSRLQKVVNNLTDWGASVGLKFNPEKTVVMLFSKSNIKEAKMPNQLLMGNKRIPFSTSTRYLGAVSYTHLTLPTKA